ncbi:MAG: YlbF family regulator [Gemmatimonadota bacterium]
MDAIKERAREIGKLLSRTREYEELKAANEKLGEDREAVTAMNQLAALEDQITSFIRAGREPETELQEEYSRLAEQLQQRSSYQAVVAGQSNFERVMTTINEEIGRGIEAGEQSRIILP